MIDFAKQTLIDAPETCDVDRNKAFIKSTLNSGLNGLPHRVRIHSPKMLEKSTKAGGPRKS